MKRFLPLIGALLVSVLVIAFFVGRHSNFSHRIIFRNDSGSVIATARIALPEASYFSPDAFAGKWMLETWADEFPKRGTSAEDYRATRRGDTFRVDLNPPWADNNVVLNAKQEDHTYKGEWMHQMRGPGAMGSFEIVPISDSEAHPVGSRSNSESPMEPRVAQPIIPPDLARKAAQAGCLARRE